MHVGFNLLEFFLMRHTEMLLFVNNQKPKVAKLQILGQQGMRSDNNFD